MTAPWCRLVYAFCVLTCVLVTADDEDDADKACWRPSDCARYPVCKARPHACDCRSWGVCVLLRPHGSRCALDWHCLTGLVCTNDTCLCEEGSRYSRPHKRCVPVMQRFLEPPGFADLPDIDRSDADFPAIPATYVGPFLVGFISLGLVVSCLFLALWCRFGNFPAPASPQTQEDKISLDFFYLPPPEMYQTPGFANMVSVQEESQQLEVEVIALDHSRTRK